MNLSIYKCPDDFAGLKHEENDLICSKCAKRYKIINDIPRFVPLDNYSSSFGFEWEVFAKTQIDSVNGIGQSEDRIRGGMGWTPEDVKDKLVLDVGCGSGRFAEIIASWGGNVIGLDYSSAVDVAKKNTGGRQLNDNAAYVQGDALQLPFADNTFDAVFSIGVLQHTAEPLKALSEMCRVVKRGGLIGLHGVYTRTLKRMIHPKYLWRPITTRLPTKTVYKLVKLWVGFALPISRFMRTKLKMRQGLVERLMGVANYEGAVPGIDSSNVYEWALLDTFDWYSPAYDQPLTLNEIESTLKANGMNDIINLHPGAIDYRAIKA